eukprot:5350725-Pyramimonas_sp.AAC.1
MDTRGRHGPHGPLARTTTGLSGRVPSALAQKKTGMMATAQAQRSYEKGCTSKRRFPETAWSLGRQETCQGFLTRAVP